MDGTVLMEDKAVSMMKKIQFDKKENWCLHTFYHIYMKDDIKMIRIIGQTDRMSTDKDYLSWICVYCNDECEIPLNDLLLWDVYYQLNSLLEDNVSEIKVPPTICFNQSNEWLKGDGEGSYFLKLLKLTEDTPCGYYYGY